MVLDRMLRWLFWIAVFAAVLYVVGRHISSQPATRPVAPREHRLFYNWVPERAWGWMPEQQLYDKYGCYFVKDSTVNVAALAVLHAQGILPHVDSRGITNAGEDHATLFPGTQFAVEVTARRDIFLVIRPDLSIVSFELQPNDVDRMKGHIYRDWERPFEEFSLVGKIHQWAIESEHTEVARFLEQYRGGPEAPEYAPAAELGRAASQPGSATPIVP